MFGFMIFVKHLQIKRLFSYGGRNERRWSIRTCCEIRTNHFYITTYHSIHKNRL
ncbi:hypothetical protein HanRHA438_Chr01g0041601 [Helianthus annuus]|nr:hypothetical protein HanRHA438_Chr01g0041601 [Helianthus annuus]